MTLTTPKVSAGTGIEETNTSRNVALHDNYHNPRTQKATGYMLFFAAWISFSSWLVQFDAGYSGLVLIMPAFNKEFGSCQMVPNSTTGTSMEVCALSALNQSLLNIGLLFQGLGAVFAGVTGNYFGRRGTVQCASAISVVGAAGLLGTTGSFVNYMVCRCINNFGLGQLVAIALVYGSECVAASKRGLLLGCFNIGLAIGNAVVAAVCLGSAKLDPEDSWQWKTPIVCQIPLGVILGVGIMMFPESPRWLLIKGKEEAARVSFGRFYNKDPHSAEITAQIQDVLMHIEWEKARIATTSWTEIYHRNDIRRTLTSLLVMVGLALSGIQFLAPYIGLFLRDDGISNPFLITVIFSLCIVAGALFGPVLIEYAGRRASMLMGYAGMSLCMLIFSAVSTGLADTPVARRILVAFICLWAVFFGGFIGPSAYLSAAELHSVRLRAYGQANTQALYSIFSFACSFWTPYMLSQNYGNLGTNVGYFYFGIEIMTFILVFFFVPETGRLTLEQIDQYFASGRRAWRTSIGRNKTTVANVEDTTFDMPPKVLDAIHDKNRTPF